METPNQPPLVVVGMSGGVDSSVSALLLKQAGYRVMGLFMKNWEETDPRGQCRATQDFEDVARVCQQLDIPYYSVNFVKEYQELVFSHFLDELRQGHTPNPDILCNREIKFKVFLEKALSLGADFLATGHYCQRTEGPLPQLLKGKDSGKDQSYFLYTLGVSTLTKVLFPIGHLTKHEVRDIARQHNLATSEKKDSTGICFIGKRDFKTFLEPYLGYKTGAFETLSGQIVGQHDGVAYHTIGQRKGLKIGGPGEAWFVVGKDILRNVVYVEQGEHHPALYRQELIATDLSWVAGTPPDCPVNLQAKVRYRQADQKCRLVQVEEGKALVQFDTPQRAITPRQSIVFYDGAVCLGGGVIQ